MEVNCKGKPDPRRSSSLAWVIKGLDCGEDCHLFCSRPRISLCTMSLTRQSKSNAGQLPKSVKVRSTCNACQQAKIRCSHEKPSCRRCQKHKIDCIYSVSRRLGRPAKKKGPRPSEQENGSDGVPNSREDHEKKSRKSTKRKACVEGTASVSQSRRTPCQDKRMDDRREPSNSTGSSAEDDSRKCMQSLLREVDRSGLIEHFFSN